jgi:hypothetical protein
MSQVLQNVMLGVGVVASASALLQNVVGNVTTGWEVIQKLRKVSDVRVPYQGVE